MTVTDIADAAGVSGETVRRAGRDLFPERFQKGRKTIFNQRQGIRIMSELRKKGFVQVQPPQNVEVAAEDVEIQFKAAVVGIYGLLQNHESRISRIEGEVEERKALLPAPQKSDRDNLNEIVRRYATREEIPYPVAWSSLYRECMYRMNVDLKTRARNRGMGILDYAESEGLIDRILAVAMELYK